MSFHFPPPANVLSVVVSWVELSQVFLLCHSTYRLSECVFVVPFLSFVFWVELRRVLRSGVLAFYHFIGRRYLNLSYPFTNLLIHKTVARFHFSSSNILTSYTCSESGHVVLSSITHLHIRCRSQSLLYVFSYCSNIAVVAFHVCLLQYSVCCLCVQG